MKQRKAFWTHLVLLIEGRLACLLLLGTIVLFYGLPLYEWLSTGTVSQWGWALALDAVITISSYFFLRFLWPQCFSRLILAEDMVIWRCPFMRPRKIRKEECRYVGIKEAMLQRGKDNWVSTGAKWVWFSAQPFPKGKNISQLRTKNGFIKFPLSVRLSGALGEWLPQPKNLIFAQFYETAQREKKRKAERRKRKREKRRRKREG